MLGKGSAVLPLALGLLAVAGPAGATKLRVEVVFDGQARLRDAIGERLGAGTPEEFLRGLAVQTLGDQMNGVKLYQFVAQGAADFVMKLRIHLPPGGRPPWPGDKVLMAITVEIPSRPTVGYTMTLLEPHPAPPFGDTGAPNGGWFVDKLQSEISTGALYAKLFMDVPIKARADVVNAKAVSTDIASYLRPRSAMLRVRWDGSPGSKTLHFLQCSDGRVGGPIRPDSALESPRSCDGDAAEDKDASTPAVLYLVKVWNEY